MFLRVILVALIVSACASKPGGDSQEEVPKKAFKVKFIVNPNNASSPCQLLSAEFTSQRRVLRSAPIYVSSTPRTIVEGEHEPSEEQVVEVYATTKEGAEGYFLNQCPKWRHSTSEYPAPEVADEVIPLIITGDAANRIDVVFMGDGYTQAERGQMIDDLKRLVNDMFSDTTFANYIPLFNIWIVFRPSQQSGIGTGGVPRNTAFRLYRDGTELRGVYCGNSAAARDACRATGPDACDYPTLIGNSPFYGGLGGEFTISTSSKTSGTVVLRHEMGHNFGQVGEEYDGGTAYFGANFANSVSNAGSKWRAWLSETPLQVQESRLALQDYPWYLLENGPKTYTFTSPGTYKKWYLIFTASGCAEPESLAVLLDGIPLEWTTSGTEDRSFYKFLAFTGFSAGTHQLTFRQQFPPSGGNKRQLCSLTLHEYMDEPAFHWENFYSAYRVWRQGNTLVGYRPTNEYCLMRNMSSPNFCHLCRESMWLQFFQRVSAIDNTTITCSGNDVSVKLNVLALGQFREKKVPGENLSVRWELNGTPVSILDGSFSWTLQKSDATGTWTAYVDFVTPEVRQDPNGLLNFEHTFTISSNC